MRATVLILTICLAFFTTSHAASNLEMMGVTERLANLNRKIEAGKSKHYETDRDMHKTWDEYRDLKQHFDAVFEELICTAPDELQKYHDEMERLAKEVEFAWHLKQEQYKVLKGVLDHENYTVTGLSTGNDKVQDTCEGLAEYIDVSNKTAHIEKVELDEHLQEVLDDQVKIDTHPCPCIWGQWEEWSTCSTTCEAGLRYREREVEKPAINNGTECLGSSDENQACNDEVCCPVNCEWGQWEEWGSCPSGCPPQEKTRIRRKRVVASCNGLECEGEDFEEKSCSREVELAERVAELESDLEECQAEDTDLPEQGNIRQIGAISKWKLLHEVATLRREHVASASCLAHCNYQAGHCPNYCGENGYCLVTGWKGGDLTHTCVFLVADN